MNTKSTFALSIWLYIAISSVLARKTIIYRQVPVDLLSNGKRKQSWLNLLSLSEPGKKRERFTATTFLEGVTKHYNEYKEAIADQGPNNQQVADDHDTKLAEFDPQTRTLLMKLKSIASSLLSSLFESINISKVTPMVQVVYAINVAVFIAWYVAPTSFMEKYFLRKKIPFNKDWKVWFKNVIFDPYWFTRITASFSHATCDHLLGNMLGFSVVGDNVCKQIGKTTFVLATLVGSFVMGLLLDCVDFCERWYVTEELKQSSAQPERSLGFSGILFSLFVMHASTREANEYVTDERLDAMQKFLQIQSLTESLLQLGSIALNKRTLIGHAAHLVGVFWGFLVCEFLHWRNIAFR
jgi:membrane associated rhomboid family serine protease